MWGDDTVRLDGAYHIADSSLQPNESSRGGGYSRLVVATRYGRKLMLKALREDVRGVLQYEELLRKEFEILFTLTHDNIVRALSFDEIEGLGHCIVMEYIEGTTLKENDLVVYDTVVPISARLIANKSGSRFKSEEIDRLVAGMAKIVEEKE